MSLANYGEKGQIWKCNKDLERTPYITPYIIGESNRSIITWLAFHHVWLIDHWLHYKFLVPLKQDKVPKSKSPKTTNKKKLKFEHIIIIITFITTSTPHTLKNSKQFPLLLTFFFFYSFHFHFHFPPFFVYLFLLAPSCVMSQLPFTQLSHLKSQSLSFSFYFSFSLTIPTSAKEKRDCSYSTTQNWYNIYTHTHKNIMCLQ